MFWNWKFFIWNFLIFDFFKKNIEKWLAWRDTAAVALPDRQHLNARLHNQRLCVFPNVDVVVVAQCMFLRRDVVFAVVRTGLVPDGESRSCVGTKKEKKRRKSLVSRNCMHGAQYDRVFSHYCIFFSFSVLVFVFEDLAASWCVCLCAYVVYGQTLRVLYIVFFVSDKMEGNEKKTSQCSVMRAERKTN